MPLLLPLRLRRQGGARGRSAWLANVYEVVDVGFVALAADPNASRRPFALVLRLNVPGASGDRVRIRIDGNPSSTGAADDPQISVVPAVPDTPIFPFSTGEAIGQAVNASTEFKVRNSATSHVTTSDCRRHERSLANDRRWPTDEVAPVAKLGLKYWWAKRPPQRLMRGLQRTFSHTAPDALGHPSLPPRGRWAVDRNRS